MCMIELAIMQHLCICQRESLHVKLPFLLSWVRENFLFVREYIPLSPFLICITCAETVGAVQQLGLGMQCILLPLLLSLGLERR